MAQPTATATPGPIRRSTSHASLAALGVRLHGLDLFGPIRDGVHIAQKTVRYRPADKLYDAFIALLAGAQGLVEINHRLRAEPALQAAFGRPACAEQSVVQDTLDACTAENVAELEEAVATIYRRHGRGHRHDYDRDWQVLDVDLSGMPCGRKAALATPGYFAKPRTRQGRQLGRVLATRYHEVVVDQLFSGRTQLNTALLPLLLAAERTLELDEARRQRTLVRVDAGGGSVADLNWVLARGYHVLAKDYSTARARRLAESVAVWHDDPRQPDRQVGLVTTPAGLYHAGQYRRTVVRVAVRCRQANGRWGVGVLISTLSVADALRLTGHSPALARDPVAGLLAYVYLYDQRGGGVETTFKEDKQGLGLTKRNKKRFEAQQVLVALGMLAHNVLVWAREWLAAQVPHLRRFGVKRLVRDAFGIGGLVSLDPHGRVDGIVLNQADRLAHHLLGALQALLATERIAVSLGET
jgi:hypothetical protein